MTLLKYKLSVQSLGIGTGFSLHYIAAKKEFSYLCGGAIPGVFISLHPAHEAPSFIHDALKVQINNIVKISIKPKKTTISRGLEKLSPKK